jgi:hypothetical protein
MTPLGEAALSLARKGMRIFPCIERTKKPLFEDNLKLATTVEEFVVKWWTGRNHNIAIATGAGSGVWVVDIDGLEGERTLRRLEAEHGSSLPATVEAVTAKGRHLYFAWPTGITVRNSQTRADIPGIDIRGEGGYVLAPPSMHPSGRRYYWRRDAATEFASAPDWLINVATRRNRAADGEGGEAAVGDEPDPKPSEVWRVLLDQDHEGSHRGHAIARLAGLLLRKYVDPFATLGICHLLNERRCVEPLARTEVRRICNEIARRENDRRDAAEAEET